MGRKETPETDWTARDETLWTTAEIAVLLKRGELDRRMPQAVPFAMQLGGHEEKIFVHGPFQLLAWVAPGDGSYMHNNSTMVAMGRGAVPAVLAFGAVRAMGNATRRARARELAQPRWIPIDHGTLSVGSFGFYMHTTHALHSWGWKSIHLASLTGPGSLQIDGQSADGPVRWILNSDWAELVFVLWASVCNPDHPQMTGRVWLPEDWATKAMVRSMSGSGYPTFSAFNEVIRGLP
ncbi:hypothetical protein [Arthrobacter sp. H5]|uniref:hypothetical protein n=1 Tax=Arthrobacter sp. H5 TaxID=1267973 RepID=UPI00048A26FB|nr:hypothetical protein [Arthrobacter sp. H5]